MTNLKLFGKKVDRAFVFVEMECVLPEEAHFFFKCCPVLEFGDASTSFLSNDTFDALLDLLERHRMLYDLVVLLQFNAVWKCEKWFKSSEVVPV